MNEIVPKLYPPRKSGILMPFQRAILQANNALPRLLEYVKNNYNMTYILTTKLNQDCLENFFSAIRSKGGLNDHPSPLEFKYRFRSYLLGRNENILCAEANVQPSDEDILPLQEETLSANIFHEVINIPVSPEEEVELAEEHEDEDFVENITPLKDIEFDGLENFGGYIIAKMGLKEFGHRTCDS